MAFKISKKRLETLYNRYNKKKYIHPDPLEFLLPCDNLNAREVTGIIAASLAYGRVSQILKCVSSIMNTMRQNPYTYLTSKTKLEITTDFRQFKYRFTTSDHLIHYLCGIKSVLHKFGSLQSCFQEGYKDTDDSIIPGLSYFVHRIITEADGDMGILLSSPEKKSACKRNMLFLRWMIRNDDVDPGGWSYIPASKLIIPLDTHMHRISLDLGFTSRKQANLLTAKEITAAFKKINHHDPVKYDFTLTRFGIRDDMDRNLLKRADID